MSSNRDRIVHDTHLVSAGDVNGEIHLIG